MVKKLLCVAMQRRRSWSGSARVKTSHSTNAHAYRKSPDMHTGRPSPRTHCAPPHNRTCSSHNAAPQSPTLAADRQRQ